MTDPDALVLDEPTVGLDLVARHRFMDSVSRLARQGTTVILVTHHVEEIIPDTRTVVLLSDGRVAFAGPPDQALTTARALGAVRRAAHGGAERRLLSCADGTDTAGLTPQDS